MLRCGNEVDVIEQIMDIHVRHYDTIFYLDDSSDGTRDIVLSYPEVVWWRSIDEIARELGDDGTWQNKEWVRQPVMEKIIDEFGEGIIIHYLHADEIPWVCPLQVTEQAVDSGCNAVVWDPMHFFLHTSQKENWESEWAHKPVLERLRFYCPGDSQIGWAGAEVKAVKATKQMFYTPKEPYRYYPHLPDDRDYITNPVPYPLYLHLGYRSPEQAMARVKHSVESGFQPVHRGLLDKGPFLDSLDGFSEVCEYQGSFGSREIPGLDTYLQCGHERKGL